jgi:hypothetical protein
MKLNEIKQLNEAADLSTLEKEVAEYLEAGEIHKPRYEELKNKINRVLQDEERKFRGEHMAGKGQAIADLDNDPMMDLSYADFGSTNGVLALKNKLAKVKKNKEYPLFKAAQAFYDKWSPLAAKFKELKEKIVTTTQKREVEKEKKETVMRQRFTDSASLIKVLTQHLQEFKDRAAKYAGEQYDENVSALKKVGGELEKLAPRGKSNDTKSEYSSKTAKRQWFMRWTQADTKHEIFTGTVGLRKKFVDEAEKGAEESYMAWVRKMTDKIGKTVQDAKMTGSPWTGSTLHVVTHDGEEQTWNNQMIINQSKYGTLFNQFPSRQVK